ncbi:ORF6N domain-containing protein [Puia dinghuensis]|uniref:DNA-binding protein n=1 Tax=Puia dinghuensis TaxID=1792502 RepID=A0A8J2UIG4_9BACT|nr:ORF6N domain-containing protein [Puia dinghuensis]GGB22951.1 DNA-binding protein [Puia dinghuensis]
MTKAIGLAEETIISKIYLIRGQKVMLDRDLAELYGVETKALKQAVRRNMNRFPPDFMFDMTVKELENWRSQNVTSKEDRQGLRYVPFCFTEQGVTMLSCILNSDRAIAVNILVIRVFTRMREMLMTHKDIFVKLEQIEKTLLKQDIRMNKHEEDIQMIFEAIKELFDPPVEPRPRIGFRRAGEED